MTSLSKTTVVNLALRELGTYRIDDVDTTDSPEAQVARDLWEATRLLALSMHEWTFAAAFATLQPLADPPPGLYGYAYQLPGDVLYLGTISERPSLDPILRDFEMIGSQIWTDKAPLYCSYTRDHTIVGQWPAWFVDYMVATLASRMCSPLKTMVERDRLEKLADMRLGRARSIDSTQQPVRRVPEGNWVQIMRTRPRT